MNVFQSISISIGSVFLGIAVAFLLLVHLSNRLRNKHRESYGMEAFLATVMSIVPLSISLTFYGLALI